VSDINTAVILSAGKGNRMKAKINKQFLMLQNKPVIAYTLAAFEQCSEIDEIIVVVASDELEYFKTNILHKFDFHKVKEVVAGGKERQQSAYIGLKSVSQDSEIILIHDGARPFVSQQTIINCIDEAKLCGAASAGMPSKDTIKIVDQNGIVTSTPPRDRVWQTQTPQAFKRALIIEAHEIARHKGITATDDAMLIEMLGYSVKMVTGTYENIKITTPDDLSLGEQLIKDINK
jgi:2-C-methyl-D-erythritol 4-phosphate cytidylyltransferase